MKNPKRHLSSGLWSLATLTFLFLGSLFYAFGGVFLPMEEESVELPRSEKFFVNSNSEAAQAAGKARTGTSEREALARLAAVPTAIWLTPEKYPTTTVGSAVATFSAEADGQFATPVFVIYGIPNRDCGNYSVGGSSPQEYPRWVAAIASALPATPSIVILEPDSLALTEKCNNADERISEIRSDIELLQNTQATIYLDAGHSAWMSPTKISALLNEAGIADVRGFATNVSNYNSSPVEVAFGEKVSSLTGGASFVIDTSRNGNGSTGQWCNPAGRKLGIEPATLQGAGHHEANLWIKPPGESDGTCNGGPKAGDWWNASATELLTNSSWQ